MRGGDERDHPPPMEEVFGGFLKKGPQLPPMNQEAEQSLLGALLIDNRQYEAVSEFLKPEHFYTPVHGRIYRAIGMRVDKGQSADHRTLRHVFESDPDLKDMAGVGYLAELYSSVVTAMSAPDYAKTIFDLYLRRSLILLSETLHADARDFENFTTEDLIGSAEKFLSDLGGNSGERITLRRISEVMVSLVEELDHSPSAQKAKPPRVMTGLSGLDKRIGGIEVPSLTIIGARPSMGKTALAITLAINFALAGHGVLFFSIEVKAEQLVSKVLARSTGISVKAMRDPQLSPNGLHEVLHAMPPLANLPLMVDDDEDVGLSQIRARAAKAKREMPNLRVLIIDYLGLMAVQESRSRDEEMGKITRGLKKLARRLGVAVILLAQLSRKVEERENKRPMLSDLRDSGNIEQDADVVIFPYRHEYYLEKDEPRRSDFKSPEKFDAARADYEAQVRDCKGMAELIVAKARDAERGTEKVRFDGVRQVFTDIVGGYEEPPPHDLFAGDPLV